MKHKKCFHQQENGTIKTPNESHLYWKKHLHNIPLYYRIKTYIEHDNEIDNSSMVIKQLILLSKTQYGMVIM